MTNQDKIFSAKEADSWFNRNQHALQKTDNDALMYLLDLYQLKPKKVLEVGAANGYRLAEIHEKYGSEVYAGEPSAKAIQDGKQKWPFIHFQQSTAADMDYDQFSFDLVIVGGVFHWVDRDSLLTSLAKIDSALKYSGHLLIGDFQIPNFYKRKYHHLKDEEVYTYKADYKRMLISTGLYKEVATVSKDREKNTFSTDSSFDDYYSASLLKKEDLYLER